MFFGHQKIAKWLWKVCPEQEQSAMLHAKDRVASRVVCKNGHLEIAEWLWNVCPEQEQKAMLHEQTGFFLGLSEWSFRHSEVVMESRPEQNSQQCCMHKIIMLLGLSEWSYRDSEVVMERLS